MAMPHEDCLASMTCDVSNCGMRKAFSEVSRKDAEIPSLALWFDWSIPSPTLAMS